MYSPSVKLAWFQTSESPPTSQSRSCVVLTDSSFRGLGNNQPIPIKNVNVIFLGMGQDYNFTLKLAWAPWRWGKHSEPGDDIIVSNLTQHCWIQSCLIKLTITILLEERKDLADVASTKVTATATADSRDIQIKINLGDPPKSECCSKANAVFLRQQLPLMLARPRAPLTEMKLQQLRRLCKFLTERATGHTTHTTDPQKCFPPL